MRKLFPGEVAPPIEATALDGSRAFVLSGGRIWLSFYRYVSCPLCSMRVHECAEWLRAAQPRGLRAVAVFPSPREKVLALENGDLPFTVLLDPESALSRTYGTDTSLWGVLSPTAWAAVARARRTGITRATDGLEPDGPIRRMPAEFLIDESGVIVEAYYGQHAADHLPIQRIAEFAAGANGPLRTERAGPSLVGAMRNT